MRFLGLDSSTQSLTALIVDTETGDVRDHSVNFGKRLPQYGSPNGFLPNDDARVKHADPLMWVAALDLLLTEMRAANFDLSAISGITGAGQQHGSVYLNAPLDEAGKWSTGAPLVDQVRPLLSRATAPIWMDSSTSAECAEIAAAAGGDDRVVATTGSRAIERFTGPQIRKFWKQDRAAYDNTAEIHLVSSFIASLMAGTGAAIDFGDGAGMNLLDLATGRWNPTLLDATAPGLGAQAQARRRQLRAGRRRRRPLHQALRLQGRDAGLRVFGRQPVQPGRHGRHRPRHRGRQPGDQRHDVRRDGGAAHGPARLRQRVRQPGRRLHGAVLLRERVARARGDHAPLQPDLGRLRAAPSSNTPSRATTATSCSPTSSPRSPRA